MCVCLWWQEVREWTNLTSGGMTEAPRNFQDMQHPTTVSHYQHQLPGSFRPLSSILFPKPVSPTHCTFWCLHTRPSKAKYPKDQCILDSCYTYLILYLWLWKNMQAYKCNYDSSVIYAYSCSRFPWRSYLHRLPPKQQTIITYQTIS